LGSATEYRSNERSSQDTLNAEGLSDRAAALSAQAAT
jgi:hypothetical protein